MELPFLNCQEIHLQTTAGRWFRVLGFTYAGQDQFLHCYEYNGARAPDPCGVDALTIGPGVPSLSGREKENGAEKVT
jgi:hypothetical protein